MSQIIIKILKRTFYDYRNLKLYGVKQRLIFTVRLNKPNDSFVNPVLMIIS